MRLIIVTFLILGFGFYYLSGGSDFEPADWREVRAPAIDVEPIDANVVTPSEQNTVNAQPSEAPTTHSATPVVQFTQPNVPTTRRLASVSAPTPIEERAELGPDPSAQPVVTKANFAEILPTGFTAVSPDFRHVSANRVNMRAGPGTQFSVVGNLQRHSEVEVLQDPGHGWVELEVLETGAVGWMSANMLRKTNF